MAVSSTRPYHHGSLRSALIETAARLAAENGPSAVTLRETARRAGVTQAAPYHYFRSKSALLAAVAEEGFRLLEQAFAQAEGLVVAAPTNRVAAMLIAYVRFALERPHYFHVMFRGVLTDRHAQPSLLSAAGRAIDRLVDAVRDARMAAGHEDLDPTLAATLVWSIPHGLVSLHLDGPLSSQGITPVMIERLARVTVETLLLAPLDEVDTTWAI